MKKAREKRPKFLSCHYNIKSFTLGLDDKQSLASYLGIDDTGCIIDPMATEVQEILTMYQCWVENMNNAPSPGEIITSIESISRKALDLWNDIRTLDIYTCYRLYSIMPGTEPLSDLTYKAHLSVLNELFERSKKQIAILKPYKGRGSKENKALRTTMMFLALIFLKFNLSGKNVKQRLRHFIYIALASANIPCPDPDKQRTRFDNLLK